MNCIAASDPGGRIINLEIRGLEECHQYLSILVNGDKVGALVAKLKKMMPELNETETIKIHRGKYLIHQEEDINILNSIEEVIVTITKKQNLQSDSKEYIDEIDEKCAPPEEILCLLESRDRETSALLTNGHWIEYF